jgi:hypothetical protein
MIDRILIAIVGSDNVMIDLKRNMVAATITRVAKLAKLILMTKTITQAVMSTHL